SPAARGRCSSPRTNSSTAASRRRGRSPWTRVGCSDGDDRAPDPVHTGGGPAGPPFGGGLLPRRVAQGSPPEHCAAAPTERCAATHPAPAASARATDPRPPGEQHDDDHHPLAALGRESTHEQWRHRLGGGMRFPPLTPCRTPHCEAKTERPYCSFC